VFINYFWPPAKSQGVGSAGDSGGDVEGDEAFAAAGVADEEGDLADGDAVGPEPFGKKREEKGRKRCQEPFS
jgi:hypothetical protein